MKARAINTLWNALENVSGDVEICCPPFDNGLKHGLGFYVNGDFLSVTYEGDHEIFSLGAALNSVATKAIEAAVGMLEENGLTLEDVF